MLEPWIIGCVINLCGSVVINIGTNLIKYHHTQQQPQHNHNSTPFFSSQLSPATPSPPTRSLKDNSSQQHTPQHKHKYKYKHHVHPHSPHSPSTPPSPHSPVLSPSSPLSPPNLNTQPLVSQTSPTAPSSSSSSPAASSASSTPSSTSYTKNVYWYIGFFLFFVGNVSNFISMGFTAQSLLAGLGSIQFITNVLCSSIILKHPVTTRVLYATFAIVVGNVLIVCFASHHSDQLTVDQLWLLYTDNQPYQIYCVILVILVLILYVYYKVSCSPHLTLPLAPHRRRILQLTRVCAVLSVYPYYQETKKHLRQHHLQVSPRSWAYKLLPFSYAAISAIIGTQSVLLAKSSSELVRTTLGGKNQFNSPFTYFILTAWITSMVFWLYRMNAALRKFDGVFIIPVLQVVWTLFSIIGGGVYFREFNAFNGVDIGLFTLGVCIVIFGVYLLAPQTTARTDGSGQGGMEEEEGLGSGEVERVLTIHTHQPSPLSGHGSPYHTSPDTEMTSLNHHVYSGGALQPYQIRELLQSVSGSRYGHSVTHPHHKYMVVSTNSSRSTGTASAPSSPQSERSFDFSSSSGEEEEEEEDVQTEHDNTPDSMSNSPHPSRQSSTSPDLSPVRDVAIVLTSAHHTQRIHLQPPEDEKLLLQVTGAVSGSDGSGQVDAIVSTPSSGYGGVSVMEEDEQRHTPRRGSRTRAMSLGLAMPMIDLVEERS